MPPKEGAKAKPRGGAGKDDEHQDDGTAAAAAAARALAEESRRLVDAAVTRGVRDLSRALVAAWQAHTH